MRGGEANTHTRSGFGHNTKKGREVDGFSLTFKTIRVYVLTQKNHFFIAL